MNVFFLSVGGPMGQLSRAMDSNKEGILKPRAGLCSDIHKRNGTSKCKFIHYSGNYILTEEQQRMKFKRTASFIPETNRQTRQSGGSTIVTSEPLSQSHTTTGAAVHSSSWHYAWQSTKPESAKTSESSPTNKPLWDSTTVKKDAPKSDSVTTKTSAKRKQPEITTSEFSPSSYIYRSLTKPSPVQKIERAADIPVVTGRFVHRFGLNRPSDTLRNRQDERHKPSHTTKINEFVSIKGNGEKITSGKVSEVVSAPTDETAAAVAIARRSTSQSPHFRDSSVQSNPDSNKDSSSATSNRVRKRSIFVSSSDDDDDDSE